MNPKQIAIDAAKEAGKILLQLSQKDIQFQMKSPHDVLAQADLESEKIIISKIKESFPNHSILSEEKGEEILNQDYLWIIDPLDGTINFTRKIEEYAISIALYHQGQLELGVIYQPTTNKLYVAEKGQGAYLNDQKISASTETETINSIVATDNSSKIDSRISGFQTLLKICPEIRHIRTFGSSSLHLAKLAEGKLDFYYKTSLNFWDFAAGIVILKEAGGKVTDFEGKEIDRNSKNIIASNGFVHQAALKLINK